MARKTKHDDHENLERWLVSYADFMTLLLAFFVVMYSISQVNEGKYRTFSDSLITAFNMPSQERKSVLTKDELLNKPLKQNSAKEVAKRRQEVVKMKSIADNVLKAMESLVKEGKVKVAQTPRGLEIEINASVLFPPGEAYLQTQSLQVLSSVGRVLASIPNRIEVEGHTDNLPISSPIFPSNWELSSARASSVVRLFMDTGVSGDRLTVIGYADHRPVGPNDNEINRAKNRRVNVMILPEKMQEAREVPLEVLNEAGKPLTDNEKALLDAEKAKHFPASTAPKQ